MDIDTLLVLKTNTRALMHRYRAITARPPRRWTLYGYGVARDHEHYFNV